MHLTDLTEDDARAIARWRYPAPYDCYDYPAWERMTRERWAICDAVARTHQFRVLGHRLIVTGICAECSRPKRPPRRLDLI